MFLVDRLDLVEERINGVVQLRMHVQRQAGLGNLHGHAAPLLELIGRRIGFDRKHWVVQRPVDAFPKKDIVDVTVALKQLDPGNLLQDRSTCSGVPAAAPSMQKIRILSRPWAFHF